MAVAAFGAETAEQRLSDRPDRLLVLVPGMRPGQARRIALVAVREARRRMPKLSGRGARGLQPIYGKGYYGIFFGESYIWYQEQGIRPFTMRGLQGKTIPMWIDDPTGTERLRNPNAKVRRTGSGKVQVLIFRKATRPGAPGRIGVRESARPWTRQGKLGGWVARGNIGVQWRHPGLAPRKFMNSALTVASGQHGIVPTRIYVADGAWRAQF